MSATESPVTSADAIRTPPKKTAGVSRDSSRSILGRNAGARRIGRRRGERIQRKKRRVQAVDMATPDLFGNFGRKE
jgi:hypothetical protein